MNGTMLQCFEWELPADGTLWRRIRWNARRLRRLGFTALWLPPAYKGAAGRSDVGYGVYDLYDLGEFDQRGSVATKYGTKDEYLRAIRALHRAGVQALPDVVLNHRLGADETEEVLVCRDDPEHRGQSGPTFSAQVFTRFTFPGRDGRYSDFCWDHRCFTGVDWDERTREKGLFRMAGKTWAKDVDGEKGNYDYLMGADVDVRDPAVFAELTAWGRWYLDTTGCDGFRLDAVKHISAAFYREWLAKLRAESGRELFAVGEYWSPDAAVLARYLEEVGGGMSLFDVPLHQRLHDVSVSNGTFDMRGLFPGTMVDLDPRLAVTFVDNHDTQPGQSLESWVEGWFKASAYALILLRAFGYPCVFYGDLCGIPARGIGRVTELHTLLRLRRERAMGEEHDYFDHERVIGFTREGLAEEPGSGLAALLTNGPGGTKRMYAGLRYAGRTFRCVLGGQRSVVIGADGWGEFSVGDGRLAVFAPRWKMGEWLLRFLRRLRHSVSSLHGCGRDATVPLSK